MNKKTSQLDEKTIISFLRKKANSYGIKGLNFYINTNDSQNRYIGADVDDGIVAGRYYMAETFDKVVKVIKDKEKQKLEYIMKCKISEPKSLREAAAKMIEKADALEQDFGN